MAITVRSKLDFGQVVYIKTDVDQFPRQVIGVQATADGGILIKVTTDGEATWHYECEINEEKDILLSMNNP
jgi:hypothetical protein